jgi:hypothetical protein
MDEDMKSQLDRVKIIKMPWLNIDVPVKKCSFFAVERFFS